MKPSLFLCLFLSLALNAQKKYVIKYTGDGNQYYSKVKSSNKDHSQKLNQLATKITNRKFGDEEKVKAIYFWIANHIAYDHELRFDENLQKEYYRSKERVIYEVLQRKKALCGGYAFLFETLCQQIGIEAKTVHGFTKLTNNFNTPNHSWNAVKINGKWQLLDITWSISNGNIYGPDTYWYFTKPEIFIKSHYPKENKWTLIKNPPSLVEFVG